jgi:hypothetical protein
MKRHETQSIVLLIVRQLVEKFLTSDETSETNISLRNQFKIYAIGNTVILVTVFERVACAQRITN